MCSHVRHGFCPFINRLPRFKHASEQCDFDSVLRLHSRGTWFPCFLIFTCIYIYILERREIIPSSSVEKLEYFKRKHLVTWQNDDATCRWKDYAWKRRERERMGESIVGESSRTFNEVYVTSLRYTEPLGQLLTLYLVLEDRRLWHGQTRFDNEYDNEACIHGIVAVQRDYNHAMRVPTCAIQSETNVSVFAASTMSRKTHVRV